MSSEEVKKISCEDVQRVQNLVELCLQSYMSQKEVVKTLLEQEKIEPVYTELVWKKLAEENEEFFKAYHLRLMVKDQITYFNQLLVQHAELMRQSFPSRMVSTPTEECYPRAQTRSAFETDNIHRPLNSYLQNGTELASHAERVGLSSNLLSHNLSFGMPQRMNEKIMKPESAYMGTTYNFGNDEDTFESLYENGDATDLESNLLNDALLGEIPWNFSFSDLHPDFTNVSGSDGLG